jgi:GTP cyclohydrolase IA
LPAKKRRGARLQLCIPQVIDSGGKLMPAIPVASRSIMPTQTIDLPRAANASEKTPDIAKIASHYAAIIAEIGGDLNSEGMRDTPTRAAKAIVEMTEGARMGTEKLLTMFQAECHQAVCHDMVIVEGISEVGLCEHHLLPILMSITIAYIPDQKILGLSKLARIAGYFARRWQNQERTAHLIAEFIEKTVEPQGVAVLIEGKHMCAMARGVRDTHSVMKVNVMHGMFQTDDSRRQELFMRLSRGTT